MSRARRAANLSGERFDAVLLKLGMMSEPMLAAALARHLGLPLFVPGEAPLGRILPDALPFRFLADNRVLPIALTDQALTVAVVDPLDTVPLEAVRFVVDRDVRFVVMTLAEFEKALALLDTNEERADGAPAARPADAEPSETDLQRLRDSASEAP